MLQCLSVLRSNLFQAWLLLLQVLFHLGSLKLLSLKDQFFLLYKRNFWPIQQQDQLRLLFGSQLPLGIPAQDLRVKVKHLRGPTFPRAVQSSRYGVIFHTLQELVRPVRLSIHDELLSLLDPPYVLIPLGVHSHA